MTNVLILADVTNLFYCLRKRYPNHKLNYAKYMELVTENKDLFKAIAYCSQTDERSEVFYDVLRKLGYEVKIKEPYIFQVPHTTGDTKTIKRLSWTAQMAIDAMIYSQRIEEVVIGSNNDELVDLIKYIRGRGVYVTVYACGVGKNLRLVADNVIEIPESIHSEDKKHEPNKTA